MTNFLINDPTTAMNVVADLPFDLTAGYPIPALEVNEREAIATMPVQQLLSLVPDPRKAEKPREVATDPALREYADLRVEVQRAVAGRKAKNAMAFSRYIVEGLNNERPFVVPPVTLYHPAALESYRLGRGTFVLLLLPYGDFFVAIDGETQRLAWQEAANVFPAALRATVKVVIHHGVSVRHARQGFYDLNTREVKPNIAVAIGMDTMDIATAITRRVMDSSDVLERGAKVNLMRRQLRRSDPEVMTISGLRTGVVTTILGAPGLQVGARPIEAEQLSDEVDEERLTEAIVEIWNAILEELEGELQPDRRPLSVASAPAILAGLGVLAHRAVPSPPRKGETSSISIDQIVERLRGIDWNRTYETADGPASSWDGVAGKFTPSGSFSIGGPKEVGYLVAEALSDPQSAAGRQIRGPR